MRRVSELPKELGKGQALPLRGCPVQLKAKNRVNILALGDVGSTMLMGLRLLGSDVISQIGICDIRKENCLRMEMEINQIGYPFGQDELPQVHVITEEELFDCDVMIFCASRGVPPVETGVKDVRMIQLAANRDIIMHYASLARVAAFSGMVCVVSDPVDHLAAAFLQEANLKPWQIQGFGLGVMHKRAQYYAGKQPEKFGSYLVSGRAYGPHGQDLVIANSIEEYDDALSRELTELTVRANLEVRELGFKPYIAPALSSAALSILLTLRGEWHYSSVFLGDQTGGAFMGIRNRMGSDGVEFEDSELPPALYERVRLAYMNLCGVMENSEADNE